MKRSILNITASVFVACFALTSCGTPAEKLENAENNATEANKDLNEAHEEYMASIETYRKETAEKCEANEKSIADFNARIENEKSEAKADYKKKVAELEQKNSDMKKKMADYKAAGKENWENFKTEFTHDMDELGKAFKSLAVNDVK